MTNVLILGANGQLARNTTRVLLRDTDAALTLYLRHSGRLADADPEHVTVVEGDVLDRPTLEAAMKDQDVVYANLSGPVKRQAEAIVAVIHSTGRKRLIFISSMGIYEEVPGERYKSVLDPYRDSAAVIEASDLDYTILRSGWFTHDDEVAYQVTQRRAVHRPRCVAEQPLRSDREADPHARDAKPPQPRREPALKRTSPPRSGTSGLIP